VGHIVITLPYITRTVHASLALFNMSLIDAARTLGLSYPQAILKVMVPGLAPAFSPPGCSLSSPRWTTTRSRFS
jgi:putative spermidine/putrescine transport system permease protein